MQFSDIVKQSWNDNILFTVLIELTYRCNLNCFFCYNDTALRGTILTRRQYFDLLHELRKLGVMNIVLSGGEPLAHPDFFELGKKAKELGFVIRIKSNGHALRERLISKIKNEIDPFIIDISLHGACAETHDRQTRVPGSFRVLMKNLELLKEAGMRFKLNSTLTAWNTEETEGMYEIADRFGVNLQIDTTVTLRDNGDREPLDIAPSRKDIESLFELQRKLAATAALSDTPATSHKAPDQNKKPSTNTKTASGGRHCGAGASTIAIDPYGTVYPCVQWRHAIGSLHDNCISDIWFRNDAIENIRKENNEAAVALNQLGKNKQAAGFCPGLAHSLTGQATEIYPVAKLRHQLWNR